MVKQQRAVLYLRVSTDSQATENQRPELLQLARTRGLDVVEIYEETASAVKSRPIFDRLMHDAARGRFDVVLVWALDRVGRSMSGNLATVLELDRIGVTVISAREPWLDTSGPVRQLLIAICSWVAQTERQQLIERTRAGIDRARRQGKKIGRPHARIGLAEALALRAQGLSLRAAAKKLGVGAATLGRFYAVHDTAQAGVSKVPSITHAQLPEITITDCVA